jgi:hypothetical protein
MILGDKPLISKVVLSHPPLRHASASGEQHLRVQMHVQGVPALHNNNGNANLLDHD